MPGRPTLPGVGPTVSNGGAVVTPTPDPGVIDNSGGVVVGVTPVIEVGGTVSNGGVPEAPPTLAPEVTLCVEEKGG